MSTQHSTPRTQAVNRLMWRWLVVLAAFGLFAVWATWRMSAVARRLPASATGAASSHTAQAEIEYWTCTMHPDVEQAQPGDCPVCGMELVAKYAGSDEPGVAPAHASHAGHAAKPVAQAKAWYRCTMPECGDVGSNDPNSRCPVCGMKRESVSMPAEVDDGDGEITLNERARRLASLATEPLERRMLSKRIRTVGKIGYDETRRKHVSAWISGRIDKLFADFTGMRVSKGDHLVDIYSPELLSAQEEYLQAVRSHETIKDSGLQSSRRSAEQLVHSARRKLELLGITPAQVETIGKSGTPRTHLTVHASIGGTIVRKRAMEGMYVKTGDLLYDIADLTHVWLLLDLYEADLPWVQPLQNVRVTAEALPGEKFEGQIVFVDPVVDKFTRTVKVRVNIANPRRQLKPEMFVVAEILVSLGSGGRAAAPAPSGSHACPMHPWETGDGSTVCPICEMAMVPFESIPGYNSPSEPTALLSVPREAVLQTGERALVYIEIEPGTYGGAEVQLGPLAQDESGREFYPVLAGLTEGQKVVTRGNFAIDSQMELARKPSLLHARRSEASASAETSTADQAGIAQPICPVMGNPINPEVFVEYKGVKVYFCCAGCDKKFTAEPEKYIPKLPPEVQAAIRKADEMSREGADG